MKLLDLIKQDEILKKVNDKNKITRFVLYLICVFLVAFAYNLFFVPNNLVIGGMSGLAIVIKTITGLNTSIFLLLSTIILLIISYLFLGLKETKKNIFCAIMFPIVVSITEPITKNINITFNSYLFTCLIATICYSIPLGIIYKIGYSTGGGDILNQIICKYRKTSVGQAGNYINILIIFTASFVYGIPKTIYSLMCVLLNNKIVDFIILGNSDSKLCIIKAKNTNYIEDYLIKDFNIGYSLLRANGGVDKKKRKTIMCVVTSREYVRLKYEVLDIDPKAFFITFDCYEVLGGISKKLLK